MGRKKVPFEEKKSRLALKIEQWFAKEKEPLSFGQILEKYSTYGESFDTVLERLRQKTKLKIVRLTFYLAIKLYIAQGKTNFKIDAKWKHNPHRKKGTGIKQKTFPKILSLNKIKKRCFLKCKCGAKYYDDLEVDSNNFLNLMACQCKICGQYNSLIESSFIDINGNKITKKIVESEFSGILMEKLYYDGSGKVHD